MFYTITTDKFASVSGNYDMLDVVDGIIYIKSDKALKSPFQQIDAIPSEIQTKLDKAVELAKESKKEELEKARLEANTKSVDYKGKKIQATLEDQDLIIQAVTLYSALGGMPEGSTWICEDNTLLEVTLADMVAIAGLIGSAKNANYIKCRQLKDKLIAATTMNEVQSIKWEEDNVQA